ncbi:MAG: hypothetical protein KA104_00275 [Candidatus Pacebacteria bacterium]|nr:hypothetical protein [Candidatus Paceibacterota bacterium]
MDQTRNPELSPELFAQRTAQFFETYQLPPFTTVEEAVNFVMVMDTLVDAICDSMKQLEMSYTPETILIFGSPLGEAMRKIFQAVWIFSPAQDRWVLAFETPKGEMMELNVFNKLEKRIDNGMEDSITYFLQGTTKMLVDGAV